jgi:hypothetical protein
MLPGFIEDRWLESPGERGYAPGKIGKGKGIKADMAAYAEPESEFGRIGRSPGETSCYGLASER